MRIAVVALLAAALAAFTYLGLERLGRRGVPPMLARWIAGTALGLLLLNIGCPIPAAPRRPLVLLDASLSLGAAGGHWADARAAAARAGEVHLFGDAHPGSDTLPDRGRSLLAPGLVAASAGDRPVVVVTDGEVDDAADIPADLLARAGIRLFPRTPTPDIAIVRVHGPARVAAGDSIPLDIEVRAVGGARADSATVAVRDGDAVLVRRSVRLSGGAARLRLIAPSRALAAGDHLLRIVLVGARDAEPRTDARLHLVTVAATPGVVLLAAPGDWDARFLFRAVRDVAPLPVRGYVRVDLDRWRSMTDLSVVPLDAVRQAARRSDLLILKGAPGAAADGARPRGIWSWPSGEGAAATIPGDWYLDASGSSPVSGAFLGAPVDSFPPATQITPIQPGAGDWTGLSAQQGRRGSPRPVVVGSDDGRTRRVTVAADGLWRWAFRGGTSEQAYRAWVASTVSWLLGGADSVRGAAYPSRPVVQNGLPIVFEWSRPGPPAPLGVAWTGTGFTRSDTLRFDGSGRAVVYLPVGSYRYRLSGGGGGTAAVEAYSDELLPRPVALTERREAMLAMPDLTAARDWLWLFGVAVAAFAAEWFLRRRLGLR